MYGFGEELIVVGRGYQVVGRGSGLPGCYYTLNVRSRGKQLALFFRERDKVEGNIRTLGKTKLTGFPRELT